MKNSYSTEDIRKMVSHVFSKDGERAFLMRNNTDRHSEERNCRVLVVLKKRGEEWIVCSEITPREKTTYSSSFGVEIVCNKDGSLVAVSGPGYDNNNGRVWIYEDYTPHSLRQDGFDATVWQCEAILQSPVIDYGNSGPNFGFTIGMDEEGKVIFVSSLSRSLETPYITLYSFTEGLDHWKMKSYSEFAIAKDKTPLFGMDVSSDGKTVVVGACIDSPTNSITVFDVRDGLIINDSILDNLPPSSSGYMVKFDRSDVDIFVVPAYTKDIEVTTFKLSIIDRTWVLADVIKTQCLEGRKIINFVRDSSSSYNYSLAIKLLDKKGI